MFKMESLMDTVHQHFFMFRDYLETQLPLSDQGKKIVIIGTGVVGFYLTAKALQTYKKKQRRKKWASVEKDVVILHHMLRGRNTPSISPFPLKLETYLRMSGIPYENDFEEPMGSKGKMPWITLNGKEIADSQHCLELLAKMYRKDFSSDLSGEEQAIATALRIMAEEHLYWVLVLWRYNYSKSQNLGKIQSNIPFFLPLVMPLLRKRIIGMAYGQGLGRHTQAEVVEMGIKDLQAISVFLGTKPYLMGDKATEVDCAVFGMLAQFLWNTPGSPFEQLFDGELLNLKDYCLRMKNAFWPDWNRCLIPFKE